MKKCFSALLAFLMLPAFTGAFFCLSPAFSLAAASGEETTVDEETVTREETTSETEETTVEEETSSEAEETTVEEETSSETEETTVEEETSAETEETTAGEEMSSETEETTVEEETSSEAEETTVEEATTAEAEETTVEEATTAEAEETTVEEETSSEAEETTAGEETSSEAEETTVEEETTSEAEETTAGEETTAEAEETTVPAPSYVRYYVCDVDASAGVTVRDARLILRAAIGINEIPAEKYAFADGDGDGRVTVSDARLALRTAIALDGARSVLCEISRVTEATCSLPGKAVCLFEDGEKTVVIPARPHSFAAVSETPAKCISRGERRLQCTVCGAKATEYLAPTGHFSDAKATCTQAETCRVCGAVITPAKGHDFAPATCETAERCRVCGASGAPAKGHIYDPATCLVPETCRVCGKTRGAATGHDYAAATYARPATCTRCGATKGDPLGVTTSLKGYKITTTPEGFSYVDGVLIVNKTYSLPAGYNPGGLTGACRAAFSQMQTAAKKQGIYLYELSGFRSYASQQSIYNRYCASDGTAAADRYSARPGHSEHQSGLAIDVNSLSASFEYTPEGRWLAAHCAEYGFIIRYPKGKEAQTGYIYEPWHIRYVGSAGLAKKITASGLCLEEYYGLTSVYR